MPEIKGFILSLSSSSFSPSLATIEHNAQSIVWLLKFESRVA